MPLRCLIVDDNEPFLGAATRLLEREGLTVAGVASTGSDALGRLTALRPDVVLVDIFLGEESGIDLARQMLDHDGRGAPTVILISTHSEAAVAELMAAKHVNTGFISKHDLSASAILRLVETAG
jgi:CheY-like chemotaxis protein